ncbi:MAG: nuclear transport factor 2 family protein [Aquaticitalea sp.]
MKNIFLLGLAIVLFNSCEQQNKNYTHESPEIEIVKKAIENYNNKNYDTSIYADTSKTYFNSSTQFMSPSETLAYHKANDALYTSRGFTDEDPQYEMAVTKKGETWVNGWFDWKGTLAGNGREYTMPIHLTYRFEDGKIVREVGFWDQSEVVLALQEIEAAKNKSVEEATSEIQ